MSALFGLLGFYRQTAHLVQPLPWCERFQLALSQMGSIPRDLPRLRISCLFGERQQSVFRQVVKGSGGRRWAAVGDPGAAHFIFFLFFYLRQHVVLLEMDATSRKGFVNDKCTRTRTRLLSYVVCAGCRTFEGLKGNFSKAISGVLVSEWVGVDSFGRRGGGGAVWRTEGGLHPFPAGW